MIDIKHIAKLARIKLTEKEEEKFQKELSSVLDFIGQLNKADTSQVEPAYQITGLVNSFRKDELPFDRYKSETLASLLTEEGGIVKSDYIPDDFYVINKYGYKRYILKPVFEKFFKNRQVKILPQNIIDLFPTENIYKPEGQNKIYGLEITGENSGVLHQIEAQDIEKEDPKIQHKIFSISKDEFAWYSIKSPYTNISQIPSYGRAVGGVPSSHMETLNPLIAQAPDREGNLIKVPSVLSKNG